MTWWRKSNESRLGASVQVGAFSDVGRTRTDNEDAYGIFPVDPAADAADRLFVVADGMGGHSRGREASTTAVKVLQRTYFETAGRPVEHRLEEAFQEANTHVHHLASEAGKRETMGTTGTALALVEGRAYLAHVGDSRVYRIREEGVEQLTCDHTMVSEMQRDGLITAQEARNHPRRGVLTRALGTNPRVEVDVIEVGVSHAGDRFLLCSDGLSGFSKQELREVVLSDSPQDACERLVHRANEQGGYDNATALVVGIL